MNKIIILCLAVLFPLVLAPKASCDESIDDVFDQFGKEYEALEPPSRGSSVRADYRIEQTAVASFYTAKILKLLAQQNRELSSKYDVMLEKYDQIIEQNKKIIDLLSRLPEKQEEKP